MWQQLLRIALESLLRSTEAPRAAANPPAEPLYYRTRDGRADYGFSIVRRAGGSYRVYIRSQPTYGSRPSDSGRTHRLSDAAGRPYVCWTGSIRNPADACRVAAAWADATQLYIRTGQRF